MRIHSKEGQAGFTLIEALMVVVLLAVLAVTASPSLTGITSGKGRYAAEKLRSHMRFAQLLAMHTQNRTRLIFDQGNNRYTLERETAPNVWTPGIDPGTREAFQVKMGDSPFEGVALTAVLLNGNTSLIFDTDGTPLNALESDLTSPAYVEVDSKYRLEVVPQTGKISIEFV
jgi:prepilin-type N-terminal cleavage/methylation domain-containing protein